MRMRVSAPFQRLGLSQRGDSFRGLLEFFEFGAMEQFGNIQQNDQAAFEFADTGNIAGFAVGKNGAGRFDLRRRNFQDFGSGMNDEADQLVVQLDHQNTVFLVGLSFGLAEALAQIHHRNNFAAEIDDALDGVGSVGNSGDFRNAHDFAHGADTHPERFLTDAKANDLKFLFHHAVSRTSGTNQFRIFKVPLIGMI